MRLVPPPSLLLLAALGSSPLVADAFSPRGWVTDAPFGQRRSPAASTTAATRRFLSSGGSDGRQQPQRQSRFQGNSRQPTDQEIAVMDEMIDKLAEAKPYELPNAVQRAFRVISSPQFFLRIAARQDAASSETDRARLSALASNLVSTLEAVVSTTEDRLDERAKQVEAVVKAAAEPASGEFLIPLSPERVQAMRTALTKLDPSSLDEGFLSTVDAWMNKSHQDGMDGMVTILQKCLQMFAGIVLDRAVASPSSSSSSDKDGQDDALDVYRTILASDADEWDVVLAQTDAPLAQIQAAVQKTMETIVLNAEAGSIAQRVQAEYLKEIAKRIEMAAAKKER